MMRKGIFSSYTTTIIAMNVVAFLGYLFLDYFSKESYIPLLALQPSSILAGQYL